MQFVSRMNSYLGIMKHYHTFRLRQHIIQKKINPGWWKFIVVKSQFLSVGRLKWARYVVLVPFCKKAFSGEFRGGESVEPKRAKEAAL
jgi:hypothetical protein